MDLTDSELRERLLRFGYNSPPITDTSRRVLQKKLLSLETGTTFATNNDVDGSDSEPDKSTPSESVPLNNVRQRTGKTNFNPKNVAMYSRCYVRPTDFWDRVGWFGTYLILLTAIVIVFFAFKWINEYSDRRYRSVYLNDGVLPKCSQGGSPGITCVPDDEFEFTVSNINNVRAALHHATLTERCMKSSLKSSDFVGLYPLFKDEFVIKKLIEELNFKKSEADMLLRNTKVLFKMNPRYDVKVLNDGLMYRNQRLLRSCNYMPWSSVALQYAIYSSLSFVIVLFVYKSHRWINKSRSDNGEERRRLIKDISDLLKQNKETGVNFISTEEIRQLLSEAINLTSKLWDDVLHYLRNHEESVALMRKSIRGEEIDVFYLK